ncbi:hypothetical protein YC2023_038759 [Brassica napus]
MALSGCRTLSEITCNHITTEWDTPHVLWPGYRETKTARETNNTEHVMNKVSHILKWSLGFLLCYLFKDLFLPMSNHKPFQEILPSSKLCLPIINEFNKMNNNGELQWSEVVDPNMAAD